MRKRQGQGFTLVELLVAMALGTILIGLVTFIWMQATRIFSSTVNNLEAYQRLRTVLDLIERDLANTNRTINMEFFRDDNPVNGSRDAAESLLAHSARGSGPATAGAPSTSIRVPFEDLDPLKGQSEFCELDNGANNGFSDTPYFFAPTLFSPPPYQITGDGYLEERHYWRDEVYVRTFVTSGAGSIPALVHYRLVQQADGRSALRRRVWWTDASGAVVRPDQATNELGTDRTSILAAGICDLKFGFFYKPSTAAGGSSIEGRWYHVGCPVSTDGGALLQSDEERGYLDARGTLAISEQHVAPGQFSGANAVSFYYEGFARLENTDLGTPVLRTIDALNSPAPANAGALSAYTNFDFPGVRPGDKIYLFNAVDDDGSSIDPDAGGPAQAAAANSPAQGIFRFPDQIYTVDEIIANKDPRGTLPGNYYVGIKLREPLNFFQLGRRWLNGTGLSEPVFTVDASNMGDDAGPPRTIRAAFNMQYRVAFLPPAFSVRVSIDDRFNRRVHQIERVVRLLQQ